MAKEFDEICAYLSQVAVYNYRDEVHVSARLQIHVFVALRSRFLTFTTFSNAYQSSKGKHDLRAGHDVQQCPRSKQ
jgi:hypothetical protein